MRRLNFKTTVKFLSVLLVAGCMLLMPNKAEAQQEILTTQWAYNKLTINPAYAGGKDVFSARAIHRQQWVQLDGRPITTVLNFHSPLLTNKMGLGVSYVHDKVGVMSTNMLAFSYSYRMLFENESTLGIGMNLGFESFKIAVSSLNPLQGNDPALQSDLKKVNAKAGFGLYYYGRNYYVGVSSPNLIPNKLYKDSDINDNSFVGDGSEQSTHIYVMAGYGIEMADGDFILKPQVLFKAVTSKDKGAPVQLDANISLIMFHRLILGTTFRTSIGNKNEINLDDVASADIMLGVNITPQWMVGYAYDFTLGGLKDYDAGSHEIMLGFDMNFRKTGAYTPRLF